MTVREATYAIVDTETDDKDASKANLLEVAVVLVDGFGCEMSRFESFVANTRPVPHEVSGINNITEDDLVDAPSCVYVESLLDHFVPEDAIVVAHRAVFDSVVLNRALGDRRWVCTERLAHHLDADAPNFKLGTLRYRYGHKIVNTAGLAAHRAMADVLVTQRVFETLLDKFEDACFERNEHDVDVQRLVDLSASLYEVKTMLFGAHAGKAINAIPAGYLEWGLKNFTDNPDLRYTFERELDRRRGRMSFAS